MHGQGTYKWKDGREYQGQYNMDKKHGFGTYRWADGRIYIGQWMNGKQHGQGEYITPKGNKRVGIWMEGKRVKWVDQADSPTDPEKPSNNNDEAV